MCLGPVGAMVDPHSVPTGMERETERERAVFNVECLNI